MKDKGYIVRFKYKNKGGNKYESRIKKRKFS